MISKTSAQVIKALIELAKLPDGKCEGAKSIATRIKAPQNYLGKVLQSLSNSGIVISQKGLGGGFRLSRPPKKIKLFEVVEQVENVNLWLNCPLTFKKCSDNKPCQFHHYWKSVRGTYYDFLKNTSIADLTG